MSTGRHARKRAAQAEERLMNEQEALLAKEEKKKGVMEKDVEGQRIATMRARFGGQVPEEGGNPSSAPADANANASANNKFKTPSRLVSSGNPMKQTILGMMLDNPNQQGM